MFESDEEAVEALKRWWKENGRMVVVGILLGVVAVVGWRSWVEYRQDQAVTASQAYTDVETASRSGDLERVRAGAGRLREEFADTPYAAQGSLLEARTLVTAGKPGEAVDPLSWTAENASDEQLRLLAALRLARVHTALDRPEKALEVLDRDAGAFDGLYREARGDALVAAGRVGEARDAYRAALDAREEDAGDGRLIRMKLNDLSGGTAGTSDESETNRAEGGN